MKRTLLFLTFFAYLFLGAIVVHAQVPTTDLEAAYNFEEGGTDDREDDKNDWDLEPNVSITAATGKIGNGLSVASGSFQALVGTPPFQGLSASSVSVWMRRASLTHQVIGCYVDDNNQIRLHRQNDGAWVYWIGTGSANNFEYGTDAVANNAWGHFVFVFDGSQGTANDRVKVYINGSLMTPLGNVGTFPTSLPAGASVGAFRVGFAGVWSTGDYDELHMYDRAISSTEVTTLYNSGNGLTYVDGFVPLLNHMRMIHAALTARNSGQFLALAP